MIESPIVDEKVGNLGEGVVLIGALGQIGRALAQSLSSQKADLLLVDVDSSGLNSLSKELREASLSQIDTLLLDPELHDPGLAVKSHLEKMPIGFRHVVNTAYPAKGLLEASRGESQDSYRAGSFLGEHVGFFLSVSCHLADYLVALGGGSLTNLSSVYGSFSPRFEIYEGTELWNPIEYGAAKAGIENLSRHLAILHRSSGLRVNCVAPGGIKKNQSEMFSRQYGRFTASGRLLEPEEVVGIIKFLQSDDGAAITGQIIVVDAGFSLG
jgi:NAD(P)-dependent dehydrogenase (short-subunit alcohol dehydrogenase family)